MKIFYSWQMDAPRKINKDFIHDALSDAIAKIGQELEFSEAERDGIVLDQDTQGVPGSPEVSRVIFEKISASRVVVTDVSLVARGNDNKPHINSNVAIELGYAYGKIGDGSVLKVMNTHYGPPTDLPFDLRIRRHPVQYELKPGAGKDMIAAERVKLAGQLASILRGYLNNAESSQLVEHVEVPFEGQRGRYWKLNEPLIPKETDRNLFDDLYWSGQRLLYFRCIPMVALPELTAREAHDFSSSMKPLLYETGYSRKRNRWGAISYDRSRSGELLIGATQLFKNREIWGIDGTYADKVTCPDDEDEEPKMYIPTGAIQREYPHSIDSIRELAKGLGYGERYTIEMGLSGAEGVHLATSNNFFDRYPGPLFDQEVFIRKAISADYPTMRLMSDFWEKLFAEVGMQVPESLVWKPNEA